MNSNVWELMRAGGNGKKVDNLRKWKMCLGN